MLTFAAEMVDVVKTTTKANRHFVPTKASRFATKANRGFAATKANRLLRSLLKMLFRGKASQPQSYQSRAQPG